MEADVVKIGRREREREDQLKQVESKMNNIICW